MSQVYPKNATALPMGLGQPAPDKKLLQVAPVGGHEGVSVCRSSHEGHCPDTCNPSTILGLMHYLYRPL